MPSPPRTAILCSIRLVPPWLFTGDSSGVGTRIGAKHAHKGGHLPQMLQRPTPALLVRSPGEIDVKDILPGHALEWARFDLGEINIPQRKGTEAAPQETRPVHASKGDGCLGLDLWPRRTVRVQWPQRDSWLFRPRTRCKSRTCHRWQRPSRWRRGIAAFPNHLDAAGCVYVAWISTPCNLLSDCSHCASAWWNRLVECPVDARVADQAVETRKLCSA